MATAPELNIAPAAPSPAPKGLRAMIGVQPAGWKGAMVGGLALALTVTLVSFNSADTGFGTVVDLALGLLLVALITAILGTVFALLQGGLVALVRAIRRKRPFWHFPAVASGLGTGLMLGVVGSTAAQMLAYYTPSVKVLWPYVAAVVALPLLTGLFAGLAFRPGARRRAVPAALAVVLAAATVAGSVLALYVPSYEAGAPGWARPAGIAPSAGKDPGQPGPFRVHTLTYGSGTDLRRPEYGRGATLKTDPVDLMPLLKARAGLEGWVYRFIWGFDLNAAPLNGRVWYPEGDGPFPLVLIAHGAHNYGDFSDPGYAYLGELLASRGYIMASVDANFLNNGWYGRITEEMGARGYLLLRHVEALHKFDTTQGSPFHGKVDLNNIALMGHSRGGEASAVAAAFNNMPDYNGVKMGFGYSIKSVVALAPCDGQLWVHAGGTVLENVNYMVIQGGRDTDTYAFAGVRQYQRATYTGANTGIRSAIWLDHMDHGQMNTVWKADRPLFSRLWYPEFPLMRPELARDAVKTFISAFLDATLKGDRSNVSLLRNPSAGAAWLPGTPYAGLFSDHTYRAIADYDEDRDPNTTTVDGGSITVKGLSVFDMDVNLVSGWPRMTRAAVLRWEPGLTPPTYSIALPTPLPAGWSTGAESQLVLSLADNRDSARSTLDLTVEVSDTAGNTARLPLSRYGTPVPMPTQPVSRWGLLDRAMFHSGLRGPVFQTVELPLADFVKASPGFDPARLKTVSLVVDKTPDGSAILDDIGIRNTR